MKLKINESKTFEFNMDTSGCSWEELEGHFRLTFENVEYGFPITIEEGVVKVNIPVFKDVLHENVRSSLYEHKEVTVKARLDLIANNEVYIKPWSGNVDIEIPVSVKLTEGEKKINPKDTKVTIIDPDVQKYLDEEKKTDKKTKFMEQLDNLDVKEHVHVKKQKNKQKQEVKKINEKNTKKKSKFSKILT